MQKNKKKDFMRGAGITYKSKRYITHTLLPFKFSAVQTFSIGQQIIIGLLGFFLIGGLLTNLLFTVQILIATISILYFLDTVFNLFLTTRSIANPHEIYSTKKELNTIDESKLPVYTILCPIYKEADVITQFIEAIATMEYPKQKLDVILLLEKDDHESIETINNMHLPFYFRTIIVPDSKPKTKPKACNYGLSFARGKYLVIYDAEDIPDPLQLKKAYLGFTKVPDEVVCLQAKLSYYNTRQNLLTRFFTAEYSLWFDLTLTGLQSLQSTIPLGGTSNHFKTQVLLDLYGWDPFNVTEDADLGVRLFKKGFKTAIMESTTYEEATSTGGNWIRQRSRWIKGYMQTYLLHQRTWNISLKEKSLLHNFIFQLTVGGKLLFLLVNPLMWLITVGYFLAYPLFGPSIEMIYRPPIAYIAVISWIFGNFLFLYYYMLGCAKRNQWDLMKYIFFIPVYWVMMSTAGSVALYQLLLKPHYWEKTLHGFHLLKKDIRRRESTKIRPAISPVERFIPITFIPAFVVSLQGSLLVFSYPNIQDMITLVAYLGVVNLIALTIFYTREQFVEIVETNIKSFFDAFNKVVVQTTGNEKRMRILIFNWRDIRHVYAGGAEVYIHELAKRWVEDGNSVTVFCGNDNRHKPNETIDGVNVIRRGGTYTVYFFAFLYYLLQLRNQFDVIIDCENGIPFFAPLITRKPVILLIHHIHQEVFRNFLRFPFRHIAGFLEGKLMPFVYRNKVIVTVSESSKKEIISLGFTKEDNIEVIYNGVTSVLRVNPQKTQHPSFVYVGRLKEYKNIDVAIKAFASVVKSIPTARLSIVGSGEIEPTLKRLVAKLRLKTKVSFLGRVTEKEKAKLLAESWAMLQPSQVEGWGITVIESNACGTPVIASRVNGLKDSVVDGKTGLLVPVRNAAQFSSAMKKIIQDKLLRNKLSQNSYLWSKNFNWDKSAFDFYIAIGKCLDINVYKRFNNRLSLVFSKEQVHNA